MEDYQGDPRSIIRGDKTYDTIMFGDCHGRAWFYDDVTLCFKNEYVPSCIHVAGITADIRVSYLRTLFPLVLCGLSILFFIHASIRKASSSKYYHAYLILHNPSIPWSMTEASQEQQDAVDIRAARGADITDLPEDDDEFGRNAQLALHPTVSRKNMTTYLKADKPKGELVLVTIEELLVIAQLAINIVTLILYPGGSHSRLPAIAEVVAWTYIAILITIRLITTSSQKLSLPGIWYHTAFLYGFNWGITLVLFRSVIIHPRTQLAQALTSASFAFQTILLCIALGSRKGNKAVDVEYEGDIPPTREPTASLFSLATFSWVDRIVWIGYKKTYELTDVWNVAIKDKAATVLADYRQVKKTSALVYHLLKYFRNDLLFQAGWACFSGVLTFVPTILLREILRYIEDPVNTPRNTVWLFVILLFVSGCAGALSDGQALWIGRHTCVRLRAVVIGEIYAKALRRKVGSTGDKTLGEKDDLEQAKKGYFRYGLLNKLFGTRRKEKKDQQTTSDNQAELKAAESQVTSGTVINLMAVDSFKIAEISAYLHFLWASTPVQVIMSVILLYQTLGFSSIAGIGMMILLLPVNMWISGKFAAVQKKILAATDARIHSTNEVLTNIRIIKYFAWEERFMANINEKRRMELKFLRLRYILWATAATIWGGAPILITFLSFAVYTFGEGKDLIPSVAFTALSLFQILRIPLDQLADMVAHVQESKVSVDRVEEFLNEEDTQKYKQLRHTGNGIEGPEIGFVDGTFTWGSKHAEVDDRHESFRLMDLNLKFEPGQLNVIAGPTGCGKTSLLMALLGEMTLLNGSVYLPGGRSREDLTRDPNTGLTNSVAYCAQQAWLVNGSVKQNVLFASNWDKSRYKQVIKACALQKDLEILDAGDETLVGEKGVTLSGGQKQRISLARALYCTARHVILDDILSAVDSHTAKWIFEKALMGPLMYNRTCILVTHNVALCLPVAQYAVLLENGRVTAQGSADTIIKSGKLGQDLTKSTPGSRNHSREPSRVASPTPCSQPMSDNLTNGSVPHGTAYANAGVHGTGGTDKHDTPIAGPAKATATPSNSALQEGKATGSVKFGIIMMYLRAMGSWVFWSMAAFIFVAQQLSNVSTNLWIREWSNQYVIQDHSSISSPGPSPVTYVRGVSGWSLCFGSSSCAFKLPFSRTGPISDLSSPKSDYVNAGYYLGVYAILGVIFMVITFLREGILFAGSLKASHRIHTNLMRKVSHAKFRFFDSTPLGQMMNRFSKDIESVDQEIAPVAVGVIHCMATIITIVILISVITPGFLIAGFFITILYVLIGKFYINSSRDLKRLESLQRSPLYQQFGETLTGMATIRAYGDERRFIRDNLIAVNTANRPFIYLWAANRWLAFRVDVVGALVSFFAGVFVVLSVGKIDAGAAGLAMTYAVSFTENVLWFVRLYAANEQNMNSVERIKEYLDVDQEAEPIIEKSRPPGDWPSQGTVEFAGYSTRYRKDYDMVLRNLTFKISPCEKVGIVGRTGAGKSSLALALFRALEAEEGKILIDGIDISTIGLRDLRENIVMVPQDPTLFTGTIRSNLDPFGLFTDEEIFNALRRVQLVSALTTSPTTPSTRKPATPKHPGITLNGGPDKIPASGTSTPNSPSENKNIFLNLQSPVSESGGNLSQGQRQLLCLARALLKEPKVLLMDEATASIDYATDSKVQATIRELKNNTIITIAHRLKTIVDYDRVVVMERGEVVEIGSPWDLLRTDGTSVTGVDGKRWFREMCEMSGDLAELEEEARQNWEAKRLIDDD